MRGVPQFALAGSVVDHPLEHAARDQLFGDSREGSAQVVSLNGRARLLVNPRQRLSSIDDGEQRLIGSAALASLFDDRQRLAR